MVLGLHWDLFLLSEHKVMVYIAIDVVLKLCTYNCLSVHALSLEGHISEAVVASGSTAGWLEDSMLKPFVSFEFYIRYKYCLLKNLIQMIKKKKIVALYVITWSDTQDTVL